MRYLFEDYALDTDRRELQRGGAPLSVEPQVFDLLVFLVRQRDRVVSKDDLLNAVWSGRIVSESALTTRINAARTAIGDSGHAQRLIRTLRGRGIRFVGTVHEETAATAIADAGFSPSLHDRPSSAVLPFANMSGAPLPLPGKPSIAVLPFINLSGDPEQQYFADGMVEDIITALSRLKSLFVIARNSSFTYKDKPVDPKRVGQELGVRYVLEGSVRRAGNRLRITGQLIETGAGSHIWADRWDCELADIFHTQDEITARIENAIGDAVVRTEAGRLSRSGRANIEAWQLRIQAWEGFHRWHREGCLHGLELGREAIRLDPHESESYAATAACLYALAMSGWAESGREAMSEAVSLLSRAINLDADNAIAYTLLGVALLSVGRHDEAVAQVKRGSELAPGSYYAAVGSGIALGYCGEPQESLRSIATAVRVSPRDPRIYATYQAQCAALFVLDRFEEIVSATQRIMHLLPDWTEGLTMQAAALAKLGRTIDARHAIKRLLALDAQYSVKRALRKHPYRDAADRDKLAGALRQAGLT